MPGTFLTSTKPGRAQPLVLAILVTPLRKRSQMLSRLCTAPTQTAQRHSAGACQVWRRVQRPPRLLERDDARQGAAARLRHPRVTPLQPAQSAADFTMPGTFLTSTKPGRAQPLVLAILVTPLRAAQPDVGPDVRDTLLSGTDAQCVAVPQTAMSLRDLAARSVRAPDVVVGLAR